MAFHWFAGWNVKCHRKLQANQVWACLNSDIYILTALWLSADSKMPSIVRSILISEVLNLLKLMGWEDSLGPDNESVNKLKIKQTVTSGNQIHCGSSWRKKKKTWSKFYINYAINFTLLMGCVYVITFIHRIKLCLISWGKWRINLLRE